MLVDTHAHLDDAQFAQDLEAVLERARAAGVGRIVTIGTGVDSSRAAVRLAQSRPGVIFACVGIHPHDADKADDAARAAIAELAGAAGVVGIGETGLDYHYGHSSREGQRKAFIWQIELALQRGLPLVLHCRDAFDEALAVLEPYRGQICGVAHCFSGGPAEAKAFLGLGLHLSFAGPLTFSKSDALREAAAAVPMERVLIETDCPYLSPVPWRGQRNEPARLTATAEALARLRGASAAEATARNAESLFGLPACDESRW